MRSLIPTALALLAGLALLSPTAKPAHAAPDCAACGKKLAELAEEQKELEENTQFLGKNRGYLADLSAKEASKFMKVSGNIQLILNRMDAIKERIKTLHSEIEKEGCDSCPKTP